MTLLIGIRLILLIGSKVTDFDGALILGFAIAMVIISFVKPYRLDIYTISKSIIVFLFLLSPFIIKAFVGTTVRIYLPWDAYLDLLRTVFSPTNRFAYPIATTVFSLGILVLIYSFVSTWRLRFYVKDEYIVLEELFPTKYVVRIPLREVLNVLVEQTSFQRAFDYGLVTIVTKDEVYDLGLIERPHRFKELVFKGIKKVSE